MSNHDAQLLELMKLSREQIAAMYGVPSRMLNDGESGTYGSLEQDDKNFFKTALQPVIKKIEEALSLILPDGLVVKFDVTKYTKGDLQTQSNAVDLLIKNKVISAEEAREMFDLGPARPEDSFVIASNNYTWGTLQQATELGAAQIDRMINPPEPPVAPAAQPVEGQGDKAISPSLMDEILTATPGQLQQIIDLLNSCLLYTSPSPRD